MATPPYTITPSFLNRIKEVVDNALANKLHAIINMHHHEALFHPCLTNRKNAFCHNGNKLPNSLRTIRTAYFLSLLNEPNGTLTPAKWNVFFAEALQRIRLTNPERIVVMGTANWGGLGGLPDLVLPEDDNLILTIHYYNPFTFTHQGAEWVE
jgi:endoglucanase